jgi:SHS2 domain-containing protein
MNMSLMMQGSPPKESGSINISVSGHDLEDIMVRWLGEILYLFEGENLVVTKIDIESFSNVSLSATLKAVPFDPECHKVLREIKAVTYHQIDVAQKNDFWTARVFFDL